MSFQLYRINSNVYLKLRKQNKNNFHVYIFLVLLALLFLLLVTFLCSEKLLKKINYSVRNPTN